MIRFYMRYAASDPDGYYATRWDLSTPIDITANTKDEAVNKALKIIGDPPRYKKWALTIDRISEASSQEQSS